jgi:hypothetical protein
MRAAVTGIMRCDGSSLWTMDIVFVELAVLDITRTVWSGWEVDGPCDADAQAASRTAEMAARRRIVHSSWMEERRYGRAPVLSSQSG